MTNHELLVRLAATPLVSLSESEIRLLADWVTSASPEQLSDLLGEAAKVHTEIRRRL